MQKSTNPIIQLVQSPANHLAIVAALDWISATAQELEVYHHNHARVQAHWVSDLVGGKDWMGEDCNDIMDWDRNNDK